MPRFPEHPYHEGDVVEVIDHRETRENTSYAHLIGKCAVVVNPNAGSRAHGRMNVIIAVKFDDGTVEGMFHWRLKLIHKQVKWEV
jgi:hypothetical protein